MNLLIAKLFHKHDFVKVCVIGQDKRKKLFYAVPIEDTVNADENHSYTINREAVIYEKGIPTYYYNTHSTEPLNLYVGAETEYTPAELSVGLKTNIVKKFFEALDFQAKTSIQIIFAIITLLAIGGVTYWFYTIFQTLLAKIDELQRLLDLLTGGIN